VILARAQRRAVRPNIWASLRSESGLSACTLSRYAATAASLSVLAPGTQRVAVGAERAAGCAGELFPPAGSAFRTEIGLGDARAGHSSSSVAGWEEFGRPHLARTALNLAQPG